MLPVNSPIDEISVQEFGKLCFDKFKLLPKTGKPTNNEWTILAGVILSNKKTGNNKIISLGCGTKCIGKNKLCTQGLILNDSHAEILARRGLIRYLYHEIQQAALDNESIFLWQPVEQKFQLKNGISLHFLSTQTPCGDACILPAEESVKALEEPLNKKCKKEDLQNNLGNVGSMVTPVYTGAKLIDDKHIDAMEQIVGAVRTKPGKGERTLSMSCSDKLAKWQIMGVQGALLDILLTKPIYFDTLIFWGENNLVSLERALWKRFETNKFYNSKYKLHVPQIKIHHDPAFPYVQDNSKKPSPNGLVWCDIPNDMKPYEISVNGKRQGITSKKLQTPESALKISKYFLFQEFLNIVKLKPELVAKENLYSITYLDCKHLAKDYQSAWSNAKINYFKQWSQKPIECLKFYVKELMNNEDKTKV